MKTRSPLLLVALCLALGSVTASAGWLGGFCAPLYAALYRDFDPRFSWHGRPPSKALWRTTLEVLEHKGIPLLGKIITPLSADAILAACTYDRRTGYALRNEGLVQRNGAQENDLLRRSNLEHNPREVAQFKVLGANGQQKLGRHLYGKHDQVQLPLADTDALVQEAAAWGGASELHLNHTHPLFEFHTEGRMHIFAVLSPDDKNHGVTLSLRYPGVIVVVRASTPAGVTYECYFKNGSQYPLGRTQIP